MLSCSPSTPESAGEGIDHEGDVNEGRPSMRVGEVDHQQRALGRLMRSSG